MLSTEVSAFPVSIPPRGMAPSNAVPDSLVISVATAKARQVWGDVSLGPIIPTCDRNGISIAYYVCFRLDDDAFPDFDSVFDGILEGRSLYQQGITELKKLGLPPVAIYPANHANMSPEAQQASSIMETGRKKTWGIDDYATVLVSARYSMSPIPEYFEGLPRFFTLADVIADSSQAILGHSAKLSRIYFGGRVNHVYEFRVDDEVTYIDPFPVKQLSSK